MKNWILGSRTRILVFTSLVIFALIQALSTFAIVNLGPFTVDEVVYHLMVKNLAEGNGLTIANGYQDISSIEFSLMFVQPAGDRLVAQYPYLYAFLAAPLYPWFGFDVLFYLNSLAFVGSVALTYRIARQFGWSESVALAGGLIYVFGTYAWEYSIAAWPHSISVFLILASFSLFLTSLNEPDGRDASRSAAAAGFVLGCAMGFRLDTAAVLPAFLIPLLFANPIKWRQVTALAIGLLPALVFMTVTNFLRWEVFSPFSYGAQGDATFNNYLPLAGIALAFGGVIWIGSRACFRKYYRTSPIVWILGALLVLLTLKLVPFIGDLTTRTLKGLYVLAIDLGRLPLHKVEPGMSRSMFDSVVYSGVIKKALLQSCPYFVFALIPVIAATRDRALRQPVLLALAIPLLLLLFYAPFNWHGGKSFNLRYLLPALPFLSLLTGWALVNLGKGLQKSQIQWVILLSMLTAIVHLVIRRAIDVPLKTDIEGNLDFFYGTLPVIFVAFFLGLIFFWARKPGSRSVRTGMLAGLVSGVVWSGLVAFAYDTRHSLDIRAARLWLAQTAAQYVNDGDLLLVDSASHLYTIVAFRPNVRIASPAKDDFFDTSELIEFSLRNGRAAYGILSPQSWENFFRKVSTEDLKTTIVTYFDPYIVRRIDRR